VATDQALEVTDPNLLQFVERMIDKGFFPALVILGLFVLVWKFGWPKFVATPPPTTREDLRDDIADLRHDVVERLERIESNQRILLDRGNRK
jgi:hypothetical protein